MTDDDSRFLRHRGTRAVQRLVELAPSTGGLALWIRHQDLADGGEAQLIASNGKTIYYGYAFEALSLAEQTGLVAHEVLHVALRHSRRFSDLRRLLGDVDLDIYNLCADAIINSTLSHLGWLKLPTTAVHLDRLLTDVLNVHENLDKALLEWDLERLYRAIDDRRPPFALRAAGTPQSRRAEGETTPREDGAARNTSQRSQTQPAPVRNDGPKSLRARQLSRAIMRDLLPSDDEEGPEDEAELSREWRERLLRAHVNDGVHSLLRALVADLPKTRTPWEHVLRTRLSRGLSRQVALSWSRPARSYLANRGRIGLDKRMPWEPGRTSTKLVPRLVVIVDVSGSIDDALLQRFAREIEAITRRLETRVVTIIGDRQVSRVEVFEPGRCRLRDIRFHGGGGTDFSPLLEEADEHRPDLGVVLTDLQGPARFRPAWPVLWAVPVEHGHAEAPFGTKLVIS